MKKARILLLPLSMIYLAAVFIRNKLYDFKLLKVSSPNAPVISVGNISSGGTGKTPMTEYLAKFLLKKNKSVAIVTKGYKRTYDDIVVAEIGYTDNDRKLTSEKIGDESLQLLENLTELNVEPGKGLLIVADNKRMGIRLADKKFNPDVIIIDDGFQHRSIERDADILMLSDDSFDLPKKLPLPAGDMREPFRNVKRADVLILNKKFGKDNFSKLEAKRPGMLVAKYEFEKFINAKDEIADMKKIANEQVTAFCGIADPDSFREMLLSLNINVKNFIEFPDHHNFKTNDVRQILDIFKNNGSEFILTTQKDMMRLKYSGIQDEQHTRILLESPLYYARVKLIISKNENKLHEKLNELIKN